jgi:hypothetical protein
MTNMPKWLRIAGLVVHLLIAAFLVFAGSGKLIGPPPEVIEMLQKGGLDQQIKLIGSGELITAILLVVPWTSSLGVLMASGFWGGTIAYHMSHHESYAMQSTFLALTWVGAYLRLPEMFSSFTHSWPIWRRAGEGS